MKTSLKAIKHWATFLLISSLLCCHLSPGVAQEKFVTNGLVTEVFGEADGIPFGHPRKVIQDQAGMIWVSSTVRGLLRYDGYSFKRFVLEEDSLTGFRNRGRSFTKLFADTKNRIWFGNPSGGVGTFDPALEAFTFFPLHPDSAGFITADHVLAMVEDDYGDLWLGTNKGLIRVVLDADSLHREKGIHTTHFYAPKEPDPANRDSILGNYIPSLYKDANGTIWAGSSRGLTRVERSGPDHFRFTHYTRDTRRPDGMSSQGVYVIEGGTHGELWLAGVLQPKPPDYQFLIERFDPVTETFTAFQSFIPGNLPVNTLLECRAGVLWVGTNDGLYRVEPPFVLSSSSSPRLKGKVTKHDFRIIGYEKIIRSLLEDHSGMVWIATGANLHKVNPGINMFNYVDLSTLTGKSDMLLTSAVIEDSQGRIWMMDVGDGLYRFDFDQQSFHFYQPDPADLGSLAGRPFWELFQDSQGRLWVGTDRGLCLYRPGSDDFACFNHLPNSPDHCPIIAFWEAPDGILWIGTLGKGLFLFDPRTETFTNYRHDPQDPASLLSNSVGRIFQDRDGVIWVVTLEGLNKVVKAASMTGNEHNLAFQRKSPEGINLMWAHEDRKGRWWLTGKEYDLLLLDRQTGKCRAFGKAEGFPGAAFNCIIEDDHGNLWLVGGAGLVKFNPDDETVFFYGQDYHIPISEGGRYAKKNSKGEIVTFADGKGIFIFHPDSIRPNLIPPKVQLTGFRLFNELVSPGEGAVLQRAISETNHIRLAHHQNNIAFEYVGLHYDQPSGNRYRIKMDNLDEEWMDVGSERIARYPDLRPGEYTFHVKAANRDGVWNEAGASVGITILPPWWATTVAYLAYALALAGLVYAYVRWRTREQRKKLAQQEKALAQEQLLNARLRQIDQLKDQFLANTSHELRTPLHGIIGIAESLFDSVAKKSADDLKHNLGLIMASGRRLASLVNDLLDFSKAKNQDIQLNLGKVPLGSLTEMVLRSCRTLVGNAPVELHNEVPTGLPPVLADANRLQQILFNLVGNAIKFTEKGEVRVGVYSGLEGKDVPSPPLPLTIFVKDTGIGIPEEKHESIFRSFEQADGSTAREYGGTGLGLSITKHLVELHGGRIWLESTPGEGSCFYFTLPLADEQMVTVPVTTQTGMQPSVSGIRTKVDPLAGAGISLPLAGSADDRIRILVVDDEPINHQVLRNHLGDDRYLITSVMSGREAIEAIELGVHFDLVLLDVMMPRMSGYEVCEQIRKKHLPSELPIIMVTAKNQLEDLVQGLKVGANDYLAKPFHKDEFLARVSTQLNLHRINTATGKFVPFEFLSSIGRDAITEVLLGDHAEREVTVLFADIRNYTPLAETMTPEENFKFVSAFNRRMGPVIRQHGGFINQYLGDAIMAIFPDHPADALAASVAMQEAVRDYNEQRKEKGRRPIRIGIGFHTGSLVMGIIGDQDRMDAATIADTVNTASRIEGLTRYYGAHILLSEESYAKIRKEQTGSRFHVRYVGQVRVKGKEKPLGIYECVDGDAPEASMKKVATLEQFRDGMELYLHQDFARASVVFQDVLRSNPEDTVVRYFLNQAAYYLSHEVPDGWTGVEVMEQK